MLQSWALLGSGTLSAGILAEIVLTMCLQYQNIKNLLLRNQYTELSDIGWKSFLCGVCS